MNTLINKALATLTALLITTSASAESTSYSKTTVTTTTTISASKNTNESIEGAKIRVLASKSDLSKGKLIMTCGGEACAITEASYDKNTIVYLPNKKQGTSRDLLNYSDTMAGVSVTKSNNHVRRVRIYQ